MRISAIFSQTVLYDFTITLPSSSINVTANSNIQMQYVQGNDSYQINDLANGFYTLRVKYTTGKTESKRIIVR